MNYKNSFFTIFLIVLLCLQASAQQKLNFNQNWQFTSIEIKGDTGRVHVGTNFKDQFLTENVSVGNSAINEKTYSYSQEIKHLNRAIWQKVSLPHSAFLEDLVVKRAREGVAYYKKNFAIPSDYKGKRLTLEFEGAMQIAWIWINGKFVCRHLGGYLPFIIDITNFARYGQQNSIMVKLDNRPSPFVPPGKEVNKMDFLYYSGLYRNVWLNVKNPLHITDANFIERIGGGGIFVTYPEVEAVKAVMNIRTNVINEDINSNIFSIKQELLDSRGRIITMKQDTKILLEKGKDRHYSQQLIVKDPMLWSPDHPYLYHLRTTLWEKGKMVDKKVTKIGIRSFYISKETGFLLNGKPLRLTGSNRHMNYPWIGNALSNNANARDAILIKQSGMNCIRLAHYPQAPSFYDACDSLGILLIDCVPGWQYYNRDSEFINNSFNDIRQTIRRDRNHPSILLWEVSLNEAYPPADYRCKQVEVAKSEWPSGLNFYTSGDSYFTKACYDVPYDDWADNIEKRNNTTYPNQAYLIREYGDFEFGGTKSTTRQTRNKGENGLLQQAWNLQWEHNRNRQTYPRCIGDLTWEFVDGISGYMPGIQGWGIVDIKRIPKYSYYFFQSQRRDWKPMCYIANDWVSQDSISKVIVYSNCDKVALFVNGKKILCQKPDNGPDYPYGNLEYGGKLFSCGDCKGLSSPPFTFNNVKFIPGELKAVGYKKDKPVISYSVHTPKCPGQLKLVVDTKGIPLKADGSDVVFVRAYVLDKSGNPVLTASNKIKFSITGDARIISPTVVKAEAGIATILLQTGKKHSKITIFATSIGLSSCSKVVEIKK